MFEKLKRFYYELLNRNSNTKTWGYELIVDLHECDLTIVKDTICIKAFLINVVKIMDMIAYGEPILQHFGTEHTTGYTAIQLVETSNIILHLNDNHGYISCNFYSCKWFDPKPVEDYAVHFWKANKYKSLLLRRGVDYE